MSYSVQPPLLALKDFLESDTNDRLVLVLGALDLDPLLQRLDRRRDVAAVATRCGCCCRR